MPWLRFLVAQFITILPHWIILPFFCFAITFDGTVVVNRNDSIIFHAVSLILILIVHTIMFFILNALRKPGEKKSLLVILCAIFTIVWFAVYSIFFNSVIN